MMVWTLPAIRASAGGSPPFDVRPMGYTVDEAKDFLLALTGEGREIYRSKQHWLDTLYPPLLAITLSLGLWIMSPARLKWLTLLLIGLAIAGAIFDFLENSLVAQMLDVPVQSLNPELVNAASRTTMLKSLLTSLVMTALLASTVLWGWQRWHRATPR